MYLKAKEGGGWYLSTLFILLFVVMYINIKISGHMNLHKKLHWFEKEHTFHIEIWLTKEYYKQTDEGLSEL